MMNKFKILLTIMICIAAIGAGNYISAQQGISGGKGQLIKQSEINQLIEFYEWAFETKFTADERERYQAFVVEGSRQDAEEARKSADVLIKVLAKIRVSGEAKQAEMRQVFNESFVEDLRAANDEESRLMLGIYERGQNFDKASEIVKVSPNKKDLSEVPKGSTNGAGSSKLVGSWMRSSGAGGAGDGTGKTRYNSGTNVTFEFFADGTMRFLKESKTLSITQCRITETSEIPGKFTVSGSQLTMNLAAGTSVGTNSCDRSGNFKKTLTASSMTKTFVIKNLESVFRPDAPLILCFDGAADDQCFERDPKK